jgi:hypothetical protein
MRERLTSPRALGILFALRSNLAVADGRREAPSGD